MHEEALISISRSHWHCPHPSRSRVLDSLAYRRGSGLRVPPKVVGTQPDMRPAHPPPPLRRGGGGCAPRRALRAWWRTRLKSLSICIFFMVFHRTYRSGAFRGETGLPRQTTSEELRCAAGLPNFLAARARGQACPLPTDCSPRI